MPWKSWRPAASSTCPGARTSWHWPPRCRRAACATSPTPGYRVAHAGAPGLGEQLRLARAVPAAAEPGLGQRPAVDGAGRGQPAVLPAAGEGSGLGADERDGRGPGGAEVGVPGRVREAPDPRRADLRRTRLMPDPSFDGFGHPSGRCRLGDRRLVATQVLGYGNSSG